MAGQFGQLLPLHQYGKLKPIPLKKKDLLIGRHPDCDIHLPFRTISGHHCELILNSGNWYVRDLNSRNGIMVNGVTILKKQLNPGDILTVATFEYEINYTPREALASDHPPKEKSFSDIMRNVLVDWDQIQDPQGSDVGL